MAVTRALALWCVVVPALVAGVVHLLVAGRRRDGGGVAGVPLALGAAYLAAHAGMLGWPPFPPREALHWTAWLVPLAAGLALVEIARLRLGAGPRWLLRAVLVGAALWIALAPLVKNTWQGTGLVRVAGLTLAALAAWFCAERALAARASPVWAPWLVLFLVASAAAVALGLTGTASAGQLAGALAAACMATLVATLVLRGPTFVPSSVPVPAWVLTGLIVTGSGYSSLPLASALLLAFAPAALLLVPAVPDGVRVRFPGALLRLTPLLVPLAAALLLAARSAPSYDY